MDKETADRIIDLQAEITALRGAVRMLLHNAYNANDSALAILREKAFQADRFHGDYEEPNERSTRYREGVREAVASLLDPFQPDNDEASRLANPASAQARPSDHELSCACSRLCACAAYLFMKRSKAISAARQNAQR